MDNFIKLNISDYTTCETYDTVCSVTGTQKVHSIVTVSVTVYSKIYRLDLWLLDVLCQNLYGRDWIQATNVSIDHIMREINKLTTVDVMHVDHGNDMHTHSDHGNEMHTHSDHGNDMHTHSEHGSEIQPTVNMCNDILCDENGSGSDIDIIYYDVVCNNVLDLIKLEEVLEPCPSDTLYTVDHMSPCSGLLSKHKKLFSEGLGKFTKGEAKIIISDSQTPVYAKARPLPYAIKEKVEDELSNMVKQNIISPISHSNWAAPIVPIQKTSGGFRICGDFKVTVNKVSKPDFYPLPRKDDLYAKLSGGTVFDVLDLSMAYQQTPISQESIAYLTINTTKGLFAFNRLPAGISAAPGIFQRLMDALFAGIPGVCVYLDDILVSGKTKQEHDKNLDLGFSVLWDAGLKLKREKCLLAQDMVTYLGHIIDNRELHPVKKKVCLNYNLSLDFYVITTNFSLTYQLSWLHSMNYSEKIHLGNGVKSNQRRINIIMFLSNSKT